MWARQSGANILTVALAPALAAPQRVDVLDQFVAAYGAALIGCTIVRMRGWLGLGATVPSVDCNATATWYIGDSNDVVRGPNANDNFYDVNAQSKDYFGVEPVFCPAATSFARVAGSETVLRMFDVKSMRKLEEVNQRLIMDISATGGAATSLSINYDYSVLLMLP